MVLTSACFYTKDKLTAKNHEANSSQVIQSNWCGFSQCLQIPDAFKPTQNKAAAKRASSPCPISHGSAAAIPLMPASALARLCGDPSLFYVAGFAFWAGLVSWPKLLTKNCKGMNPCLRQNSPFLSKYNPHVQFKASKSILKLQPGCFRHSTALRADPEFSVLFQALWQTCLSSSWLVLVSKCVSARGSGMWRYHLSHSRDDEIPFLWGWRSRKGQSIFIGF